MIKTKRNEWKYGCLTCGGRGYEEKLSCGCTGYRMKRRCTSCKGKGVVKLETFKVQEETQRKYWDELYK